MSSLQIKRQRDMNVDPKQVLRAYIDQLPLKEQRDFIVSAFQLMAERITMREAVMVPIFTSRLTPKREVARRFPR